MKTCSICRKEKASLEFSSDSKYKDGLFCWCRDCCRLYRLKNKKRISKIKKDYYEINKESIILKVNNYNKLRKKEYQKYQKEYQKGYYLLNKKQHDKQARIWRTLNPEKACEISCRATAKRLSTPKGKINSNISRSINQSLRGGMKAGRHWETLVEFTVIQLKAHLENLFTAGMTWDNYGEWHIDHKIPIAVFNFDRPEDVDFKRCWALENLQPLWAKENMSKGAKLDKHFQPSLRIAVGEMS